MGSNRRAAWWATVALFLVHGLVVATWISRIPAIKSALGLSNLVFGVALAGSAVGSLCAIPVAGWLVGRYGSRTICVGASVAFCLTVVLPSVAWSAVTLAMALYIFGGSAAAMGVAMNSQAVEVERAMRRPTMSRFHAMFSLGAMVGAAAGGALAAAKVKPLLHFSVSAGINLAVILAAGSFLLDVHEASSAAREQRLPWRSIPRVLFVLSAIGFCIFMAEGAMADWIALYLHQVLNADMGTAAAGYSVFSAAMAVARFLGDAVTARLGAYRTVLTGSLLAATGLTWAICMPAASWALPGFGLAGCGFSVIIPLVFGSAGRVPGVSAGPAIATVSGLGYFGFIVGPPLIGFLSQLVTLRWALAAVVAGCLAVAWLAREMRGLGGAVTHS